MGMFSGFFESGEAINLQNEYKKIYPDLQRLYRTTNFKAFFDTFLELTEEFTSKDNLTKKGMKSYQLSLLNRGVKVIDQDMATGCAFIMAGVYFRSCMIDNDNARETVSMIESELDTIDLVMESLVAHGLC